MKLQARTRNIEVTPSICDGQEDSFSIVFRYPSQVDLMALATMTSDGQIISFLNRLFVEFKNKPEITDEDGELLEYENFSDMMGFGGSEFTSILVDVVQQFEKLQNDAGRVEKKS